MASANRISRRPTPAARDSRLIDDHRFRALLSDENWGRLPLAIWRRFSMRLADGETIVYVGEVDQGCISFAGWCLAQLVRLIGAPLPRSADTGVPIDPAAGVNRSSEISSAGCAERSSSSSLSTPSIPCRAP